MCMKNININTMTFTGAISAISPFDRILSETTDGGNIIEDFNVLISVSAIMPSKQENASFCVVENEKYNILVRLNHVRSSKGFDLQEYLLDTTKESLHHVCKSVLEKKWIVSIPKLILPKGQIGQYAIKVFIKNEKDKEWFVQSIQTFMVEEKS